jgi:hypothetical protein
LHPGQQQRARPQGHGTEPSRAGRPARIELTVRNNARRPARSLTVTLTPDARTHIVGPNRTAHWGSIPARASARRVVEVVPREPGRHRLVVSASSASGASVGDTVAFTAAEPHGDSGDSAVPLAVYLAVAAGAVGVGAFLVRRRTPRV